jgi:hypothetical protein
LGAHRFGTRLHNTSALITASEIIKDSATGCCSPSPPLADFTTWSSGVSDSEGCSATIIAQRLDPLRSYCWTIRVAYRAYRTAVRYAGDRTQGRTLDSPGSDGAPIAIINHPDIQRMLLTQKCYAEGALAIVLYCAALVDREAEDPRAAKLLALLTPIAKTWPAEWGLVANDLAIQVHGGYGYTRDFDVEQLYRDNRLNPIHEGTTGIQALDLLGRKILRSDDDGLHVLGERIGETIRRAAAEPQLLSFAKALEESWALLGGTIDILRTTTRSRALANATSFLFGFGHTVIAWLWLDQALLCTAEAVEGEDDAFYAGKRRACRFFYAMELPKTGAWLAAVGALSDVAIAVPREEF